MFLKLIHASEEGRQTLNPVTLSVQEDEDFIGRPSRLSRRITSRRPLLERLMTRYLQAVYDQYVADGFIIRPVWFWMVSKSLAVRHSDSQVVRAEKKWLSRGRDVSSWFHNHFFKWWYLDQKWKPRVFTPNLGYSHKPWEFIGFGFSRYIYIYTHTVLKNLDIRNVFPQKHGNANVYPHENTQMARERDSVSSSHHHRAWKRVCVKHVCFFCFCVSSRLKSIAVFLVQTHPNRCFSQKPSHFEVKS